MKKLILSLLIFFSVISQAQIQIPQVVGLPSALSSKATKAELNLKQPVGTYSTDIHSNITALNAVSNTNTGDETLTSIKTKLGAASAVSDGYLKYQDWNTFNSKEPAITKNTAFNKNFGTTAGTVLEGRTFGTAANSAVGDFIQNQNASAQSANMWINGTGTFGGSSPSINGTSDSNTSNSTLSLGNTVGFSGSSAEGLKLYYSGSTGNSFLDSYYANGQIYFRTNVSSGTPLNALILNNTGAATFSSTVNSTGFLLNGNNLTSSLTTNYIPKWNGSSMVNSLISDDGTFVNIGGVLSGGFGTVLQAGANINSSIASTISNQSSGSSASANLYLNAFGNSWVMRVGSVANNNNAFSILTDRSSPVERFKIETNGVVTISSTTTSTAPTTGALVVGGGIGADHVRANNFYGNGSNLTGVQLPITLTTNGTSGAATFSGNVLNVPNYASTGTGGEFTSNYTNISNTTLSTSTLATYTNINGIINASVFGAVTSTSAGKCTFRVSVPTTIRSGRCAVISGVESGKTTSANIFIEGTGSTYVDISFIASAPSSILEFKLITMGF